MVVSQSVNEIREELAEVNREIDVLEVELSALCHQKKLLKHGLIDALNRYHLDEAGTTADGLLNEQAFGVEAWIPKNKLDLVQSACDELHLVLEKIAIEKKIDFILLNHYQFTRYQVIKLSLMELRVKIQKALLLITRLWGSVNNPGFSYDGIRC